MLKIEPLITSKDTFVYFAPFPVKLALMVRDVTLEFSLIIVCLLIIILLVMYLPRRNHETLCFRTKRV